MISFGVVTLVPVLVLHDSHHYHILGNYHHLNSYHDIHNYNNDSTCMLAYKLPHILLYDYYNRYSMWRQ